MRHYCRLIPFGSEGISRCIRVWPFKAYRITFASVQDVLSAAAKFCYGAMTMYVPVTLVTVIITQFVKREVPFNSLALTLSSVKYWNRYCLVIVEYFSKWVELISLQRASAKTEATTFYNQFNSEFGTPLQIVSNNRCQLVSEVLPDICNRLQIQHILTVLYFPQANMAERVNRTLIELI